MFKTILTKYLTALIVALVFTAANVLADNAITVNTNFYHIDKKHNIIIINKGVNEINAGANELKSRLILDKEYALTEPTLLISTSLSYQAKRNDSTYTVYFTQLPIIHIDTKKQIMDSPSVYANFVMSEANGSITKSNLGIEIRGAWSQSYPKKSYELSFWDDTTGTITRDLSLLKMRTDNKWNLQAMYNEPLRSRSKTSNELWQDIHQIYYKDKEPDAKNGIAMTYVELFINNEYKGVYALSERIDRKQLKLKKYNNGIIGELYKGSDWGGATTFTGLPPFDNTSLLWGGFEYKHPEEKTNWTNLYNFVDFVENSNNQDFYSQYQKRFNLRNAVDYYVFLNLLRATDNTGKNVYIAKYKTDEPYYYVPWDLDGVLGYNWFGAQDNITNDILSNGFYDRLIKDYSPNGFNTTLSNRWSELRSTIITDTYILAKFKANNDYLLNNNIYDREHLIWNDFNYDETNLAYTTTWLQNRLKYLDATFNMPSSVLKTSVKHAASVEIYPNPASNYLYSKSDGTSYELSIQDMNGRTVSKSIVNGTVNKIAIGHLTKGVYIVTIKNNKSIRTEKLLLN
jgi:hypothetical protein